MKKLTYTLFVILSLLRSSYAQHSFQWAYDNNYLNEAKDVIELPSGEMVVGGFSLYNNLPSNTGAGAAFITKLASNGEVIWTHAYKSALSISIKDFKQTPDGGFILVGNTSNAAFTHKNFMVLKVNNAGTLQWAKEYGASVESYINSSDVLSNGTILITGHTVSLPPTNLVRTFIVKLNETGDIQFATQLHGTDNELICSATKIIGTNDGGFIVTGEQSKGSDTYYQRISLSKFNSSNNLQWSKLFTTFNYSSRGKGAQTSDGGYIISGAAYNPNENYPNTYLVKTDSLGNMQWSSSFENIDTRNDVMQDVDGGIIVTGGSTLFTDGSFSTNAYILKTNNYGNIQWVKYYRDNTNSVQTLNKIHKSNDNGFLACGRTGSQSYIIKTDANGNTPCNSFNYTSITIPTTTHQLNSNYVTSNISYTATTVNMYHHSSTFSNSSPCLNDVEQIENSYIQVYPNPTTDLIHIDGIISTDMIEIIDITGKVKSREKINPIIDVSTYPKGLYLIKLIRDNKTVLFRKIILQ